MSPIRGLEPRQVRSEVASAWRSYFGALARPGPALVVIEDLHWAGAAMLELLQELADGVDAPVMFLCPARSELTSARPGWGARSRNFSGIMLDPLGGGESEHLLELLIEGEDERVPPSVRTRVLERAGGNPFFLEETVRNLVETQVLTGRLGAYGLARPHVVTRIPETVHAVLAARELLMPALRATPAKSRFPALAAVGSPPDDSYC